MKIRVYLSNGKKEMILIDFTHNFCMIHKRLNEIYGITGWNGYKIITE